jgi:hypothetical protein
MGAKRLEQEKEARSRVLYKIYKNSEGITFHFDFDISQILFFFLSFLVSYFIMGSAHVYHSPINPLDCTVLKYLCTDGNSFQRKYEHQKDIRYVVAFFFLGRWARGAKTGRNAGGLRITQKRI